ncbi:MAG: hypothetical protein KF685_05450, partial [Acidobacteria bacterium]|nr:hypothetical protein [Acidobacteriota bacterium]
EKISFQPKAGVAFRRSRCCVNATVFHVDTSFNAKKRFLLQKRGLFLHKIALYENCVKKGFPD